MNFFPEYFQEPHFTKSPNIARLRATKQSTFTKSASTVRLSTAKWLASSVAQQQQCCSLHTKKSSNNPLYTAQYAASWGSNLCGVQDLPELIKVLTNFETGKIQD